MDNDRAGKGSRGGGDGRCSLAVDDGDGCCLPDDAFGRYGGETAP